MEMIEELSIYGALSRLQLEVQCMGTSNISFSHLEFPFMVKRLLAISVAMNEDPDPIVRSGEGRLVILEPR
jgi:hypothetical protein